MVATGRPDPEGERLPGSIRERATELAEKVRSGATTVRKQVAQQAGEITQAVRDEAGRLLDEQKVRAAARVGGVASTMHRVAGVLQAARIDPVAGYVEGVAGGADRVSSYLEERQVREMVEDAGDAAKRYPAAFLGGMLAVGLALGLFVKVGRAAAETQTRGRRDRQIPPTEESEGRRGSTRRRPGRNEGSGTNGAHGRRKPAAAPRESD